MVYVHSYKESQVTVSDGRVFHKVTNTVVGKKEFIHILMRKNHAVHHNIEPHGDQVQIL